MNVFPAEVAAFLKDAVNASEIEQEKSECRSPIICLDVEVGEGVRDEMKQPSGDRVNEMRWGVASCDAGDQVACLSEDRGKFGGSIVRFDFVEIGKTVVKPVLELESEGR